MKASRLLTSAWIAALVASSVACTKQTPDAPPATAVVMSPSATMSVPVPAAPASDPSLPPASVVANAPDAAASAASQP